MKTMILCLEIVIMFSALLFSNEAFWMTSEVLLSGVLTIPSMNKSEACNKNGSGKGIFVNSVIYRSKDKQYCFKLVNASSVLMETFRRHCNGKNRCLLSQTMRLNITLSCDVTGLFANVIDVNYECKPIRPDNQYVFSMSSNLRRLITDITYKYYLVLETHGVNTMTSCKLDGRNEGIKFTLLHADFGPETDCKNATGLDPSFRFGFINVTINRTDQIFYTCNGLPNEILDVSATFVTIDVNLSTGLIWIEVAANKDFILVCTGFMDDLNPTTFLSGQAYTTPTTIIERNNTKQIVDFSMDIEMLKNRTEGHRRYRILMIIIMPCLISAFVFLGIFVLIKSNFYPRNIKIDETSSDNAEVTHGNLEYCNSLPENAVLTTERCTAVKKTIVYRKAEPLDVYNVPNIVVTPP